MSLLYYKAMKAFKEDDKRIKAEKLQQKKAYNHKSK